MWGGKNRSTLIIFLHDGRVEEEAGDRSFLSHLEEFTGIPKVVSLCQNMSVDKTFEGAAHAINALARYAFILSASVGLVFAINSLICSLRLRLYNTSFVQ